MRRSLPPPDCGGKLRDVANPSEKQPRVAVDGVVLAAGASTRMGSAKSSLEVDGTTFMTRAVKALRDGGCRDVIAVIGPDNGPAGAAASQAGARVVMNVARDSEQIDSLRLAIRNLDPGAVAIAVLPVDHPLASAATTDAVIRAWAAARAPIARPTYAGVAGHPTVFAAELFDELLHGKLPEGARSVVAAHAAELLDVEVPDPGVTADIDTPDDYRRLVGEDR